MNVRGGELLTPAEETRRLRVTIDHVPGLLGYWDGGGYNVTANAAFFEYFGLTPAQVRGRHLRDVLGEALYALIRPFIDGALAGEEQLFEHTLVDRYGVPRHTEITYTPDFVDGEVRGFVAQIVDVTYALPPNAPATKHCDCSISAWPTIPSEMSSTLSLKSRISTRRCSGSSARGWR